MSKLLSTLLLLTILVSPSCGWFKERKAEHHQPFGNHKEKKPHHK